MSSVNKTIARQANNQSKLSRRAREVLEDTAARSTEESIMTFAQKIVQQCASPKVRPERKRYLKAVYDVLATELQRRGK